jgi:hypothetical protein
MATDAAQYYTNLLEQMETEKDKIDQTDNRMDYTS